jgi:hypothetical protein
VKEISLSIVIPFFAFWDKIVVKSDNSQPFLTKENGFLLEISAIFILLSHFVLEFLQL